MRIQLKKRDTERATFSGSFEKYGSKGGKVYNTILLKDIRDASGVIVCDHLWLNRTKSFDAHGILNNRDVITFDARVKVYKRKNNSKDYKLSYPTNVKLTA